MSLLTSFINNVMGQNVSEPRAGQDVKPSTVSKDAEKVNTSDEAKCREPLEWKFIDFTKAKRCPIFDVDPVMLKRFIGHNVTVLSSSRLEFQGCCLAIDPVSLSVILANRVDGGKIRVVTVPGYYLSTIRVNPNAPLENIVSVNDLDVAELYHAPSLYSENSSKTESRSETKSDTPLGKEIDSISSTDELMKESPQLSTSPVPSSSCINENSSVERDSQSIESNNEYILKRKEKLIDLLKKHRMPITVKDAIIEIPGGVTIQPPYTMESCDTRGNQIIKKRLGELIELI